VKKQTRSVENAVAERPCWCKSSRGTNASIAEIAQALR
jgi:hypothetical protein